MIMILVNIKFAYVFIAAVNVGGVVKCPTIKPPIIKRLTVTMANNGSLRIFYCVMRCLDLRLGCALGMCA